MSRHPQVLDRNALVNRARALRRAPTLPERLLWQVLRERPDGLKFRRQHPIGRIIVDFYCPAAGLVVKVDGESHDMGDRPERDARRDAWLKSRGLAVVRLLASDVMKDVESAVTEIVRAARR